MHDFDREYKQGMCQRDINPTKEQETTQCHQWVVSSTQRDNLACRSGIQLAPRHFKMYIYV